MLRLKPINGRGTRFSALSRAKTAHGIRFYSPESVLLKRMGQLFKQSLT